MIWCLSRYVARSLSPDSNDLHLTEHDYISSEYTPDTTFIFPSLMATLSAMIKHDSVEFVHTLVEFTPILPYIVTDYDTIYTCMSNYQDVLQQKNLSCGAVWCDYGVYHLAKELQIVLPNKFSNIFLGLGGFHMEKIVESILGKFLVDTGISDILVELEIYGPNSVKQVMDGKHYIRSKRGMSLIAECMQTLRLIEFNSIHCSGIPVSKKDAINLQKLFASSIYSPSLHTLNQTPSLLINSWNEVNQNLSDQNFFKNYEKFISNGKQATQSFNAWSIFLDEIYPILFNLTQSFRSGDWQLHISAVRRAIPLFFSFDHINYARWAPLYLEHCLSLEKTFPDIYHHYMKGGFVAKLSKHHGSSLPYDQSLEKAYNKPAKVSGGVIGVTRKKECMLKYDLTKQEKEMYVDFLSTLSSSSCSDEHDEFNVHYEFNSTTTAKDFSHVNSLIDCILSIRGNPFALPSATN